MKSKAKLLFIVMAALMLFAAIEVMAQEQYCPESCTAGPYTISLLGVSPSDCKDASGKTIPCYDYSYSLVGPLSSLNQIVALIPVCCENPIITYPACPSPYPTSPPFPPPCSPDVKNGDFGDSISKIYAPGDGDPTSKIGLGVGMVYAVRSEPHEAPNPHLFSSSIIMGPISMQIKSGTKYYYCKNIVGPRCPDCGVPPQVPSVVEKRILIEGVYVKLTIDANKCVQSLSLCNPETGSCRDQVPVSLTATSYDDSGNPDTRLLNSTINEISDIDGNQRCAWGRLHIGNHTCTSVPSGIPGKYFLVGDTCKCTSPAQCYPGYNCVGGKCTK